MKKTTDINPAKPKIGKKGKPVAYDYEKYRQHYLKNREKIIAYKKSYQEKNNLKCRSYKAKWRKNNLHKLKKPGFFLTKAYSMIQRLNNEDDRPRRLSVGLISIWRKQRGRCALSGRKLDRTAHVDHRLPVSRGGSNELDNLQFLSPEVNIAKSNLTDSEFIKLCMDVVKFNKTHESTH